MRTLFLLALALPCFGQWASPGIGFDFRATSGFVTDPASTQFVLVSPGNEIYPQTNTIGGVSVTYGFINSGVSTAGCAAGLSGGNSIDQNAGVDARLAGVNYIAASTCMVFRVDLPAAGSYTVTFAAGWGGGTIECDAVIWDNTSSLFTICNGVAVASSHWVDATGVTRTSAADWVSNEVTKTLTFSTSTFFVTIGKVGSSDFSMISHLRLTQNAASAVKHKAKMQ